MLATVGKTVPTATPNASPNFSPCYSVGSRSRQLCFARKIAAFNLGSQRLQDRQQTQNA
jgi:hypothetical protein